MTHELPNLCQRLISPLGIDTLPAPEHSHPLPVYAMGITANCTASSDSSRRSHPIGPLSGLGVGAAEPAGVWALGRTTTLDAALKDEPWILALGYGRGF